MVGSVSGLGWQAYLASRVQYKTGGGVVLIQPEGLRHQVHQTGGEGGFADSRRTTDNDQASGGRT
jgi:hypothetical protein